MKQDIPRADIGYRAAGRSARVPPPVSRAVTRLERDQRLDVAVAALHRVSSRVGQGKPGAALRGDWLGHALHPLLTDLPLGCWLASGLLDVGGRGRHRLASQRLVGIGLVLSVPTALSGLAEYQTVEGDHPTERVGLIHGLGNVAVLVLYLRSWRSRRAGRHLAGVAFGLAGGAIATITGYLGGHLSFVRGAGQGRRGDWASAHDTR